MIRKVLAVVVVLAAVAVGYSTWRHLDQPVRAVRVEGTLTPAEQSAIRDVVERSVGRGLLSLRPRALSREILELSWPRSVAIRRVWPDTLVIRVDRETAVAAWNDGRYLNSAGEIVDLPDGQSDVPELAAALSPPRRAMEVYQMLQSRAAAEGFSIERLEENRLGEWLVTFERGTTLSLGDEDLNVRLERFLLAYRRVLADEAGTVVHADARYDRGLAVRWADGDRAVANARKHPESRAEYALR